MVMAAEIRILSGARKGERFVLDAAEVRIGADRQCQVRFDPAVDPAARHRSILLRLTSDGWLVSSTGSGEVLLNQTPLVRETRIRSGDLVRLSDQGPDFTFAITNDSAAADRKAGGDSEEAEREPRNTRTDKSGEPAAAATTAAGARRLNEGCATPRSDTVQHLRKRLLRVGAIAGSMGILAWLGFVALRYLPENSKSVAPSGHLVIEQVATCTVREGTEVRLEIRVRATETLEGRSVFELTNQPADGAAIDQDTGVFTWTPTEKDGPGRYEFRVRVTRGTAQDASAESSFQIDVTEVNSPVSIQPVHDQEVHAGEELDFMIAAQDNDHPANAREFRVVEGPEWVSIDPASGAVRCAPPKSVDGRFDVTIRVCDNGTPPLEDTTTFGVVVRGDPWLHVQRVTQESLFIVHVQLSGPGGDYSWPFATCTAIGGRTLLTSANEVVQMAWYRDQGYRISAVNPTTGFKADIRSFRVSREFAGVADTASDWIFVNLGLLETEQDLPKGIPLATSEELSGLEEGMPIACMGYPHDGSKITRFDSFEAHMTLGKVYVISSLTCPHKVARLIELKSKLPEKVYGSPVLNARGAIVAIYGESAPRGMASVQDLHYAPVLDLDALQSWLRGSDNGEWVTPPSEESLSPSPGQPLNQPKQP